MVVYSLFGYATNGFGIKEAYVRMSGFSNERLVDSFFLVGVAFIVGSAIANAFIGVKLLVNPNRE